MATFEDLNRGKTVGKEKPLACEQCGKVAKNGVTINYLCPQCKQSAYCGKKCQMAAWSRHEPFCESKEVENTVEAVVQKLATSSISALVSPKKASLDSEIRALLLPSVDVLHPPAAAGMRVSMDKHHSTFMPNGEAWNATLEIFMGAVSSSNLADYQMHLKLLESMAASSSTGPDGRGEADIAKYFCGKAYHDTNTSKSRKFKVTVDHGTVARYWLDAAKAGFAYALCGLGNMAMDGEIPGSPAPDFALAKQLIVK